MRCGARRDWLLTKEVRRKGDWSIKRPMVEPSGWYFEFANEFYPDIDDTAHGSAGSEAQRRERQSRAEGLQWSAPSRWLLAMQSKDGGWAAFDVDNNWELLSARAVRRSQRDARPDLPGHHGPGLEALCAWGVAAEQRRDSAGREVPAAKRRKPMEAGTGAGA